jgi:hypothetical protein
MGESFQLGRFKRRGVAPVRRPPCPQAKLNFPMQGGLDTAPLQLWELGQPCSAQTRGGFGGPEPKQSPFHRAAAHPFHLPPAPDAASFPPAALHRLCGCYVGDVAGASLPRRAALQVPSYVANSADTEAVQQRPNRGVWGKGEKGAKVTLPHREALALKG